MIIIIVNFTHSIKGLLTDSAFSNIDGLSSMTRPASVLGLVKNLRMKKKIVVPAKRPVTI